MDHARAEHPETHLTPDGHVHDHETKDVNIRGILISGVILLATTVLTMIGVAVLMRSFYLAREQRAEAARPARYADLSGQFPDPRLQGNPTTDMVKLRAEAAEDVSRYNWDPETGVATIPLDRALDIVAARGLPARGQARPEAPKAEAPAAEAAKPEEPKTESAPTPSSAPEEPKKAP
jgi:hypothetical protein